MLNLPSSRLPSAARVRRALRDDVPAVIRLIDHAHHDVHGGGGDVARLVDDGHLLVLDLAGHDLGAVAHVSTDHGHGQLDLLVVAPELHGHGIEDRMSGVAEALCEAYGCDSMDVAPVRR